MERIASLIPKKPKIYKVPSRFDLTTVFIVTFAYAAFFGTMQAFGVPMQIQAMIIGLLSLVGVVQMFVSEQTRLAVRRHLKKDADAE